MYEEEDYDLPHVILGRMKDLNDEISEDLAELEDMLG